MPPYKGVRGVIILCSTDLSCYICHHFTQTGESLFHRSRVKVSYNDLFQGHNFTLLDFSKELVSHSQVKVTVSYSHFGKLLSIENLVLFKTLNELEDWLLMRSLLASLIVVADYKTQLKLHL